MIKWIHHLLEPHCPYCREESQDNSVCKSCETLKMQLEIANYEKRQLLDSLLRPQSVRENQTEPAIPEQIRPRTIPWVIRKQMLEAEDREKAKLMSAAKESADRLAKAPPRGDSGGVMANMNESITSLEKELGVEEGVS